MVKTQKVIVIVKKPRKFLRIITSAEEVEVINKDDDLPVVSVVGDAQYLRLTNAVCDDESALVVDAKSDDIYVVQDSHDTEKFIVKAKGVLYKNSSSRLHVECERISIDAESPDIMGEAKIVYLNARAPQYNLKYLKAKEIIVNGDTEVICDAKITRK